MFKIIAGEREKAAIVQKNIPKVNDSRVMAIDPNFERLNVNNFGIGDDKIAY